MVLADRFKEAFFMRHVCQFRMPDSVLPCITRYSGRIRGPSIFGPHPVPNSNSKHIDVRYYYLGELVRRGECFGVHVESMYQHAEV